MTRWRRRSEDLWEWDRPSSWVRFEIGVTTAETEPFVLTLMTEHTLVEFERIERSMECQHRSVEVYLHEGERCDVLTPIGKRAHVMHGRAVPLDRVQEPA